jgi:NhaP-type Na+/H+ and K+/H+ antiporter
MRNQIEHGAWPFPKVIGSMHECAAFHGFVVNGSASVETVAAFYGLKIATADRAKLIVDYLREHLCGYPLAGDRVPLGAIDLVVLKKCGRTVEQVGLDLCLSRVKRRAPTRASMKH